MENNIEWMLTILIIPVLIGFFKTQIGNFLEDYMVYKNRNFDSDNNPATGQDCMLQSPATGEFSMITIDLYEFSIFPAKRRVITSQKIKSGKIIVAYPYSIWKNLVKGSVPSSGDQAYSLD